MFKKLLFATTASPTCDNAAKVAFDLAKERRGQLCSVDKANVLDVSQLWRDVVIETHKDSKYSGITLEHMYCV